MNTYLTCGDKAACYGCSACSLKCPKSAIIMSPDNEGFLYPSLNKTKCIGCGICETACPHENVAELNDIKSAYAFINSDNVDLFNSSSGGAFIAIAKEIINLGGLVCGCIFNNKIEAIHCLTDNLEVIKKMQGSKYVQSDLRATYKEIKTELDAQRYVLFVGTPCQVAGLKCFIGKNHSMLYTIDLICHGVPSPSLLSDYIDLEKRNGNIINDIRFRDKSYNGWSSSGTISINNKGRSKIKYISPYNNGYYNLYYLNNEVSRMSCYSCKYAQSARIGDITIGDCWNIDTILPSVDYSNGVSILLINSDNGFSLLEKIRLHNSVYKVTISDAISGNGNLSKPSEMPSKRKDVYFRIKKYGLEQVVKEDCHYQYVKPFIRKLIPIKLKIQIKKLVFKKRKRYYHENFDNHNT